MFEEHIGGTVREVSHKLVPAPDGQKYAKHIHDYAEILLFLRGDADYNVDGVLYRPKPYDLLLIPKATYHYLIPRSPAPYENYVIDFQPSLIPSSVYERVFPHPSVQNIRGDAEFCRFFQLLDYYRDAYSTEDFRVAVKSLIREMLIYCSYRLDPTERAQPERHPLVDTVLSLISENLEAPLDAEFFAKRLMLSKSYIQNVFSASMHIGLKQYVAQKKIFAAQADLAAGLPAAAVCAKYAFGDYSVFYRTYKKILGYPPSKRQK